MQYRQHHITFAALMLLILWLTACSTTQIHPNTRYQPLGLDHRSLISEGMAFLTPSTITGQEEDKQVIAFVFTETLARERPDIPYLSLPQTLSAINDAGLSHEYKDMLLDYRATGIFPKATLAKIHSITGKRFFVQLKLSGFEQESRGRFSAFGLRILETKLAHVRIFLQIWDSKDGTIAWEATEELNYSRESTAEKPVTFNSIVSEAAKNLISYFPSDVLPRSDRNPQPE